MTTPNMLPRPGVKVFTEFRNVNPTIFKPQMPACVMGVAKEVVQAVLDDGTLNSQALLALPARIEFPYVSTPFQYATLGGLTLQLSVNNGPTQTITFPGSPANPTVAEVKAYIDSLDIVGLLVDIETSGAQQRIVLRTVATGPFATLSIMGGTSLTVLNLRAGGYTETGRGGYNNFYSVDLGLGNYPNPRSNLDELTLDYTTVRVFAAIGGGAFVEVSRTSTFMRGATSAVSVFDDGDGDNLSPYLTFAGQNFTDGAAVLTGTVDLSGTFGALNGTSAIFSKDGAGAITTNFSAAASAADIVSQINAAFGSTVASLGTSNHLVLTSGTTGPGSSFERTGGSATSGNLGLAIGDYAAGRRSRARTQGSVDLTGLTYGAGGPFATPGRSLIMSVDGEAEQTLIIGPTIANAAALVTAINTKWQVPAGNAIASLNGGNKLVLRSPNTQGGEESVLRINSLSTAIATLGITAGRYAGNAYAPAVGDEVFGNGIRLGLITEVAPAGVVTRLRLDTEYLLTATWVNFYIRALDLTGPQTSTRPSADLQVDATSGEIIVKHETFRAPDGTPTAAVDLGVYLGYTALRRDVSAAGTNSNLLRIGDLTTLESKLSPISPENPLGLGMYFAMLSAPGLESFGLGIGEATTTEPFGTLGAWAEAYTFIESKDVYAIAQLTHDLTVSDLADAHVTAMSDPEVGLERVVFNNPTRPERTANELIGSGSLGNSTGGVSTFDTGLANLPALLAAAGHPAPPYDIDDRIVLKLEDDTNNYLITGVAGSLVTVSTGALAAGTDEDNADGFYFDGSSPAFANPIVDRPFSIFIRGTVLADLTEEAIAYAAIPQGYKNRRMIFVTPDKAKATIDGLEQEIEGFYVCAALAGKTASKLPADPMTNVGIKGFTGLIGASDRYGEIQYRIMDGGGLWNMFQETAGQSIQTRHQLTSDVDTIEQREFSILTALDFTAKFLRGGLRNYIGRFNITQNLQSSISTALDGLGNFLTVQKVLASFKVARLVQNPDQPDSLLLDLNVGVFYPCNEIKVTLIV
jgi:hypothetical protein